MSDSQFVSDSALMPITEEERTAPANAAEELLRDLFENTSEMIQSIAPDGRFLFVNRAWRETLGYTVDELRSINAFDVIHPDHHESCGELMQLILAGEEVGRFETEFVKKNGDVITVSGSTSVKFEDGVPVSTRGFFIDITEQKRMEAERDASFREMEKAVAQVKALAECLPVCSWCKKVRGEEGDWNTLEKYLLSHPDIQVTHGMCPDCFTGMKDRIGLGGESI